MADVVITLKIMPESPEADLSLIEKKAKSEIKHFAGESQFKVAVEPVAFGLKSLSITFVMDESKGSTEKLEQKIRDMENVSSAEVVDVRRAIG